MVAQVNEQRVDLFTQRVYNDCARDSINKIQKSVDFITKFVN